MDEEAILLQWRSSDVGEVDFLSCWRNLRAGVKKREGVGGIGCLLYAFRDLQRISVIE
jgi:hypothetical protein